MDIQALYQAFLSSSGVTTDTRQIQPGQIFFALKGERFDGNQYTDLALENGAAFVVIDDATRVVDGKTLLVQDVLTALQELGRYHRRQVNIPMIGITGSNGKTTTKELMNAVLKQKYNVLATRGNLNNHIGVPLTLLQLKPDHEIAIIEMGANHVHEIAELCAIAEPDHGLITSIGKAHIGEFGGLEAVKKTKAELYEWLRDHDGQVFINNDQPVLLEMADRTGVVNRISYGTAEALNYTFRFLDADPFVRFRFNAVTVQSQLPGSYNFQNLMTAAAVGQYLGVPEDAIVTALESYTSDNNRSQIVRKDSLTIIMDAYNANPTSMDIALDNLKNMKAGRKMAIIGDMLELGEYSLDEHQAIVDKAEKMALTHLVLVGEEFGRTKTTGSTLKFRSSPEARDWLQQQDLTDMLLLLKGSRGIKLEQVLYPAAAH